MESIQEGQPLTTATVTATAPDGGGTGTGGGGGTGDEEAPTVASNLPPTHPQHRRHRSRGGHSRSESLAESLADIVDILQTIDEVPVERPGDAATAASATTTETTSTTVAAAAPSPPLRTHHNNRHRRGQSSLSEIIMEEVQIIGEAFVEELDHADEGEKEFFFLDMSLARQMSILPEDVVRVAEVTAPLQEEIPLDEDVSSVPSEKHPLLDDGTIAAAVTATNTTIPISAYFLLASAVVALSSVGPLLNLQTGINPVLKVYWRMSATALCLSPLTAISIYNEGGLRGAFKLMTAPNWITMIITAGCYATMCVAFVLALQYTAVGNAVILSNSQAILLLIGKFFVGHTILPMEATGAVVAFSGAAFCSIDSAGREGSDETTVTNSSNLTLLGDGLALLSATGGVLYLTFAKAVRPNLNLYVFMFLVMACGSTLILICLLAYSAVASSSGFHVTLDRNVLVGTFGWMNPQADRLPLELTMVILCNLLGAMGYVRAMVYFDNLIIAVATLLEPVIATITAVFLGVGVLPGTLGWFGNAMVALGTFAVVYPSASSGKGGGGH